MDAIEIINQAISSHEKALSELKEMRDEHIEDEETVAILDELIANTEHLLAFYRKGKPHVHES